MEYLVNVAVHQVAGLTLEDGSLPSPSVHVWIFDEEFKTNIERDRATCTFGHTFTLTKYKKEEDFLASDVKVMIMHNTMFKCVEIGNVIFSLNKVYSQDHHFVPKGWFAVLKPGQPGDTVGFVQLTIGAYARGDAVPRAFGSVDGEESAEGQSVKSRVVSLPQAGKVKNLFQLMVRVLRAEELRSVEGILSDLPDPWVQVDFAGTSQTTQVQSGKNPVWSQEVRVPYQDPCWDDSVNVYLKSKARMGQELTLGEVCLHIDDLVKDELKPTWFNFYYAPPEASSGFISFFGGPTVAEDSAFAGRLLLSACVERTETPALDVRAAPALSDPVTCKGVLWVDLYEVCIDGDQQPEGIYATVQIGGAGLDCNGQTELQSPEAEKGTHTFSWSETSGQLEEAILGNMPDAEGMCADIIMSIHAKVSGLMSSSWERFLFARIPATTVFNWDTAPKWYELQLVQGSSGPKNAGFVLMGVNLGRFNDKKKPKRVMPIKKIERKDYVFRARIYQAVNLPFKDREGGSDPFVVVFFGPAMLRTHIVRWAVHPTWNQALEAEVRLPETAALRPDILIYVLDRLEDGVEALAMYRYTTGNPRSLPPSWNDLPVWLNLERAPGGDALPENCRLLVAFELEPKGASRPEPKDTAWLQKSIDSVKSEVEFYTMGIRMWERDFVKHDPQLVVAWGRKEQDGILDMPKKFGATKKGTGREGDFNFNEKLTLSCTLAKDMHFQEWLEVKLLDGSDDMEESPVVAFANVNLEPYLPWVERKQAGEDFGIEGGAGWSAPTGGGPNLGESKWAVTKNLVKDREEKLCRALGWDVPSIDASNVRRLSSLAFTNLNEEDDVKCQSQVRHRAKHHRASIGPDPTTDVSKFHGVLADFAENFTWPKDVGGDDGMDQHPDLDGELEHALLADHKLPYDRTPLFIGTKWGGLQEVGVLKYCCRVVDKESRKKADADMQKRDEEWARLIKDIEKASSKAKDMVVRAYILSADGLISNSGLSDISSYVASRMDREQHTEYRHHTLHPQFHVCHVFSPCQFPGNCTMNFTVMESSPGGVLGGGGDLPIGSTRIDLEDRWFITRYREMVQAEEVPIESRQLVHKESSFSKGHLRLWVDILAQEQSQKLKIVILPSTDPLQFQLRVVIWKVKGIDQCFENGETPAIYVTASHKLDTGEEIVKQTDTHLNTDDGTGTFNWRMLFDVFVPCRDPRLQLRVWMDNYMSDDALAEVTLDLARDFYNARKSHCPVELQRGAVRLSHAAFPGEVRGEVELEAKLLPWEEAMAQPVGEARDPPNEDPFCDPDDPHLKAHRDFFANMQIIKNIKAIGGALLFAGKWMTILYALGSIVGGLFVTAMSIYMMTSKR